MITYGAPSPVEGTSGTGVTLDGSSGQIVASQPITNPTTYSEEMWFKTTTTNGGYLMGFGTSPSGVSDQQGPTWCGCPTTASSTSGSTHGQRPGDPVTGLLQRREVAPRRRHPGPRRHEPVRRRAAGEQQRHQRPPQSYLGYWRVGGEDWPVSFPARAGGPAAISAGPSPAGQDSLNNGTWSEVGGGAGHLGHLGLVPHGLPEPER